MAVILRSPAASVLFGAEDGGIGCMVFCISSRNSQSGWRHWRGAGIEPVQRLVHLRLVGGPARRRPCPPPAPPGSPRRGRTPPGRSGNGPQPVRPMNEAHPASPSAIRPGKTASGLSAVGFSTSPSNSSARRPCCSAPSAAPDRSLCRSTRRQDAGAFGDAGQAQFQAFARQVVQCRWDVVAVRAHAAAFADFSVMQRLDIVRGARSL